MLEQVFGDSITFLTPNKLGLGKIRWNLETSSRWVVEFLPLYLTVVFYFEGVELTCRNTIHKTGDDVVFEAIPHPEIPFIVDFFYWKIDDGPVSEEHSPTKGSQIHETWNVSFKEKLFVV